MTTQNELISLIFKIGRLMRKKPADFKRGFSIFQVKVLSFIDSGGEPTMKDIADNFCVTCPSATAVIDRLAELGIIRRVSDAKDRRIVRLALTSKGKITLKRGLKELSNRMEKMLSGLNKKDREDLKRILNKIVQN
jgi:DNA-binding MarR family transcriptional regulator